MGTEMKVGRVIKELLMMLSVVVIIAAGMVVCECACHHNTCDSHSVSDHHHHVSTDCDDTFTEFDAEYLLVQATSPVFVERILIIAIISLFIRVVIPSVIIRRLTSLWREYDTYRGFNPYSLLLRAPSVLV